MKKINKNNNRFTSNSMVGLEVNQGSLLKDKEETEKTKTKTIKKGYESWL